MAKIFPLQSYRYTEKAGPLDRLVTQPYDKITREMQARYLSLSPYNLVRVILGERFPSDAPGDNVYTRASRTLEEWIGTGILARDTEESLFVYWQEFSLPESDERLTRKGFIGLGAVEDYSEGTVHRHEQTLTGPRQDRLELLRHTRAHFGQIFMLYPDPAGNVDHLLDAAAQGEPLASVTDEYGTLHRVWRIADPAAIAAIREGMSDRKLVIADGHHRYETALAFRNENPNLPGADRVMMTFVNMHSPGLRILATHRIVHGLAQFDSTRFLERARESYGVTPLGSLGDLRNAWSQDHPDLVRIGVALADGVYLFETARRPGMLDVGLLHQGILDNLLSIGEADVREQSHVRYAREASAAAAQVASGAAQAAFLLEPVAVEEVARIAFEGGVMPQKSTDFYPKLLSGLAAYVLGRD
jgi:uncharacterized protein (DUF1015 family)